MQETEVKILEVNRAELEEKLKSLGAKKVFEGELSATLFDNKKKEISSSDGLLRLRDEGGKFFLTHKGVVPSAKTKIRDETEIEVSDIEKTKKILKVLGFEEIGRMKKKRISYKLGDLKFEFDKYTEEYDFIPEFLEIESESEEEIKKILKKLGLSIEDTKPWSMKDLIKHYS